MRIRGKAAASWRTLASTLLWATVVAKSDTPTLGVKEFKNLPANLNYFPSSDAIIFHDREEKVIYRSDDAGVSWAKVGDVPANSAYMLVMHDFDPERAYVIGERHEHYKTTNRGKSWTKFDTELETSAFRDDILRFHAGDPDRIIFNGMKCQAIFCEEETAYTTDNFKNNKMLRGNTAGCWWAKSTAEFTTGQEDLDAQRILCIARDPFSPFKEDQRLMISDNYFSVKDNLYQEFEPDMDTTKGVAGVANIATVKKYILVATTSFKTDEMALFVTDDTLKWHRAMFPTNHGHTVNQEAYTVLESTSYSIQIDVMTTRPGNPMGVLFTSNSNGTYFTENLEYTNRNERGHVDFEKISGIQGIFLVNKVENGEEVNDGRADKKIVTEITFDDGRTFSEVKAGDERIHLHSVTQLDNLGRVFSSPAPGLVMGNGNTGKNLKSLKDANLYVSDNAGVSWKKALDGPHKYEFGDQGSILVAVRDSDSYDVKEFSYSLDHGENWKQVAFPDDLKLLPIFITTTQDSSSLKFLLLGKSGGENGKFRLISIDFEGLHERTCSDGDMEDFHARVDSDGKSSCLMGHKQTFQRRKKTAECFIKQEFKEPVSKTDDCDCTDADFECDYNFVREGDECVQKGKLIDADETCKGADADATFKGSSGWRRIPGDTCKRGSGKQKDDLMEHKCSESTRPPSKPANGGNPGHDQFVFDSQLKDFEKIYLERGESSSQDDETVIVRPVNYLGREMETENKLWRTTDHGKTWHRILEDEDVAGIYPHTYFNDAVFFTTRDSKKVIYTMDRGNNFQHFEAPWNPVTDDMPFSFHPDKKDWLLFMGRNGDHGPKEAALSKDRGDHWETIQRYVSKCEFTGHSAYQDRRPLKQIMCLAKTREDDDANNPKRIVVSNDFFDEHRAHPKISDGTDRETSVKDFATMSEFIVVAAEVQGEDGLLAFSTMDGETYAQAKFPVNWQTNANSEYTVLDSSTHAINLFVATETGEGQRYGNIIKSNSNGTEYVLSALGVNCNDNFYVDFEKIPGLEGVSVINTVANRDRKNEGKKLQTKITHDDGSQWLYLPPPAKDMDGKSMPCRSSKGDAKCALHLHGYTERDDKRKTYSAATAVGLMFGFGNVGDSLGKMEDADTYMTTDAGVTWKQVQKGIWTWQYGDQGSITVLVKQWRRGIHEEKTNYVLYSTDEGTTWDKYEFSKEELEVYDITSLRSGGSRNFILWCKTSDGSMTAINVDFSGLATRPCEDDDYVAWIPQHPEGGNGCLFGHKRQYLRKKKDSKCFNDQQIKLNLTAEDCPCERQDFECAYNFELDSSKQCKLVPGYSPLTAKEWCEKHPDAVEFLGVTGYRKIPLTTCKGGKAMDEAPRPVACAGHEDEFKERHRVSGVAIFFAVAIPFAIAGLAGWWVWRNWQGKFGQIRLGEQSAFDSDAPWVRYPVIAVSAVVALIAALPLVATSIWRSATSAYERVAGGSSRSWLSGGTRRFTTRDSFARGTEDYAVVDDDEGELLGEDSDEDV